MAVPLNQMKRYIVHNYFLQFSVQIHDVEQNLNLCLLGVNLNGRCAGWIIQSLYMYVFELCGLSRLSRETQK